MPARDPNFRPPPPPEYKCWECGGKLPPGRAGKCDTCANPPISPNGFGVELPKGDALQEAMDRARKRSP